jgi:aminoglycoside 3-N-acetyltransferase
VPYSYRDLTRSFSQLRLGRSTAVVVHAPPGSVNNPGALPPEDPLAEIRGGAETFLGVLLSSFQAVIMPAFTLQTMVIPETGPPDNGVIYGSARERNLEAKFFRPGLPVDPYLGTAAEALRIHPQSSRSNHPLLSFCGVNAGRFLDAQTLAEPLAPVGALEQEGGWVILAGADHTMNVSIHWAEKLAGRKQFVRWALTPNEVVECPAFPGCSRGFNALAPRLETFARLARIGDLQLQAFPLKSLAAITRHWIETEPAALLCDREDCACCQSVRRVR